MVDYVALVLYHHINGPALMARPDNCFPAMLMAAREK